MNSNTELLFWRQKRRGSWFFDPTAHAAALPVLTQRRVGLRGPPGALAPNLGAQVLRYNLAGGDGCRVVSDTRR